MHRQQMFTEISSSDPWDFIVIGGGATGLGIALDAASRGFRTLLLEKHDFAQETSSRSTKLIHGGVRYLRSGQLSLVHEALYERSLLMKNASHLVHPLSFILPTDKWLSKLYYYAGIKLYDGLAGTHGLGKSRYLSKEETNQRLPSLKDIPLHGGVEYVDGQFDDARLAINLAQTIVDQGGTVLNYMPVVKLIKENKRIIGVAAQDLETNQQYEIYAKQVINATGAFVDTIRQMDENLRLPSIMPSQGAHIVLNRSFFPGDTALIIPETEDGRVLFFIPWKKHVLIGTTETALDHVVENPRPFKEEINYLLDYSKHYLIHAPMPKDILSTFAGIRPLVNSHSEDKSTSRISREHKISCSLSGLLSVTGGKWTTYRKIAEDTVDQAVHIAKLTWKKSETKTLPIHGSIQSSLKEDEWSYYGSDASSVEQLAEKNSSLLQKFHPDLSCRPVDVLWAIRYEMARTIEDVLSRRSRCLLLDARACMKIAPQVAAIMGQEWNYDSQWEDNQVKAFQKLALNYLCE